MSASAAGASTDLPTVVAGAGVVGLACAVALARAGRTVVVLERERRHGQGTSSRNSGVIHAGLYYQPGSLKAALCVEGRERLYAYARERGLPHRRCGKLVVATEAGEVPQLETIAARARQNGVADVEIVGRAELARMASPVTGVAALWSPSTGIVDPHALMDALVAEARALGADFAFYSELVAAEPVPDGWRLTVRSPSGSLEEVDAATVVNAAGLHADEVAALILPAPAPRDDREIADGAVDAPSPTSLERAAAAGLALDWVKGNYFSIRPGARAGVDALVYPCPQADLQGLGIHLTLDLDGGQRLGPDVEPMDRRVEDYSVDPARGARFLEAARRYLPHLTAADLEPAFAGLRPLRRITGFRDFYIAEESASGAPGWINLVGIDSPGLTAALVLGEHVAAIAVDRRPA